MAGVGQLAVPLRCLAVAARCRWRSAVVFSAPEERPARRYPRRTPNPEAHTMRVSVVLLLFALPAFGQQDVEVTVRLKAPRAVVAYSPPPPPVIAPAGCRGQMATGSGCVGRQAGG